MNDLKANALKRTLERVEELQEQVRELRAALEDAYPLALAHAASNGGRQGYEDMHPIHRAIITKVEAALSMNTKRQAQALLLPQD